MKATILAASLLMLSLWGCGSEAQDGFSSRTFYYNESDGLNTLDPAKISARAPWWVGEMIYTGLVGLDTGLTPVPRLAKSWEVSEDGLIWTFHLRNDVYFADDESFPEGAGRPVTVQDVRYSFQRICNPAAKSTGFWVFRDKVKGATRFFEARDKGETNPPDHVEGFRIVDDSTFQIELVEPFAPFLSMLSIPYCYIVPQEAVERYGEDFFENPVGAGPFRLIEWIPDQQMTLVRNERYFEQDEEGTPLPYLDTVSISFIRDPNTEFLQFEQGLIDVISSIDPTHADRILGEDLQSLSEEFSKHHLHMKPVLSVEYYGFNLDPDAPGSENSPFTNNRYVRQALNYAIDREAIIRYVLKGRAISAQYGPLPPGTPGFSGVEGYRFDRERARRFLDSAGYPNGKGLPEMTLQMGFSDRTKLVGEAVQEQLKAVGINLKLKQVDFPQHLGMVRAGKLALWRTSWIADYPDAENFIALFYSPYASPAGPNTTHYSHPLVDSLYREALDPRLAAEQRATLYGRAERQILDDAPWVLLYYNVSQRLSQPWVQGYTVDPLDRLSLTRVKKEYSK